MVARGSLPEQDNTNPNPSLFVRNGFGFYFLLCFCLFPGEEPVRPQIVQAPVGRVQLPGEEQRAFPGGPVAGACVDEGDRDLPTAAEIAEFPNLTDLSAGLAPVVAPIGEKKNAEILFPHPVQEVSGDGEG